MRTRQVPRMEHSLSDGLEQLVDVVKKYLFVGHGGDPSNPITLSCELIHLKGVVVRLSVWGGRPRRRKTIETGDPRDRRVAQQSRTSSPAAVLARPGGARRQQLVVTPRKTENVHRRVHTRTPHTQTQRMPTSECCPLACRWRPRPSELWLPNFAHKYTVRRVHRRRQLQADTRPERQAITFRKHNNKNRDNSICIVIIP